MRGMCCCGTRRLSAGSKRLSLSSCAASACGCSTILQQRLRGTAVVAAAYLRALPLEGLLASLRGMLRNSSLRCARLSCPALDHAASRCTAALISCRPSHRRRHVSIARPARSAPAEHLVLRNCAAVRLLCATASDATARLCAAAACVRGIDSAAALVFSSPL